MTVYCDCERCVHNKEGKCGNKLLDGEKAIYLEETLGGDVICSNQKFKPEVYGDEG